jgi:hypothetical protein
MLEALLALQLDQAVLDALAAHYPMHPAVQELLQGAAGAAGLIRRSSSGAAVSTSAASVLVRTLSPATSGGSGSGQYAVPASPLARGGQPAAQGLQTHLVVLYEPLVQCLVAGDLRVRHLLQQLLLAVGKELQLLSAR